MSEKENNLLGQTNNIKGILINNFADQNYGKNQYNIFLFSKVNTVMKLIGSMNATFKEHIKSTDYTAYKLNNNNVTKLNKNDKLNRKEKIILINNKINISNDNIKKLILSY